MRLINRKHILVGMGALIIPTALVFLLTVSLAQNGVTTQETQLVKLLLSKRLGAGAPERVQLLLALKDLAEQKQVVEDRTLIVLADNITVRDEAGAGDVRVDNMPGVIIRNIGHPRGPDDVYPAVGAMVRVGKRGVPQTIRLIEENDQDSIASSNAIFILMSYFRENPAAAIKCLTEASWKSSTDAGKNRLRTAATYFEQSLRE